MVVSFVGLSHQVHFPPTFLKVFIRIRRAVFDAFIVDRALNSV